MSVVGSIDQANNAPKNKGVVTGANMVGPARGNNVFANTTKGAFVSNTTVGLYAISVPSMPAYNTRIAHAGWVVSKKFTGPVATVLFTGGTGYSNNDTVLISNGTVNAVGNVVTNGTGNAVGVNLTNKGAGFVNNSTINTAFTTSGTGAVSTVVLGGRAGRVQLETLYACGSITGNTYLP